MATGNFYKKNATHYYAFEVEDDFEYELFWDELMMKLEKLNYEEWDGGVENGKIVARKVKEINDWLTLVLEVVVRNGYYSGINLDWEARVEFADGSINKLEDFNDEAIIEFGGWLKNGAWASKRDKQFGRYLIRNAGKLYEGAYKKIEKEIDKLEAVFAKLTTPLERVATFSNGETIYARV